MFTPQDGIFPPGTWVRIHRVVLAPGERAPQVPEDTRAVPLEMRVKGFLLHAARAGEEVAVRTLAGREVRGTLAEAWPAYPHGFGRPVPELLTVGEELRSILRGEGGPGVG